jgi:hypothetical protein
MELVGCGKIASSTIGNTEMVLEHDEDYDF